MESNRNTPVVLLTWNPRLWQPPPGPFADFLLGENLGGKEIVESWSTGTRTHVPIGSIAFLVRQNDLRGIVASGITVSEVYQQQHWADKEKAANFVDVRWEIATPVNERVPVEDLLHLFPRIPWNYLQGSGMMPGIEKMLSQDESSQLNLVSFWDNHLTLSGKSLKCDSRDPQYFPGRIATRTPIVDRDSVESFLQSLRSSGSNVSASLPSSGYVLVGSGIEIDALQVLIGAYNATHPDEPLNPNNYRWTKEEVVGPLRSLGYFVEDSSDNESYEPPVGVDALKYVELAQSLVGSLDLARVSGQRREQSLIRGALGLYSDPTANCGICGNNFPVKFLVAGHVKKRSACDDDEKRDVQNVAIPVCLFGCDVLFERRVIKVVDGVIKTIATGSRSVDEYLRQIEGNIAPGYTADRARYFDWHANQPVLD